MPLELALFGFHLVTALVVLRLRNLFAAAMMTSIFSLLSAGLFVIMDAVDVAFTEAAVGAGISTILILGALALTGHEEKPVTHRPLPLLVVVVTGMALLYGTLDMPAYGDPNAPIHHHVAPDYIEGTEHHFGIPNVVTAVLGSYRGYDTLGETTVVFMAAIGVALLLSRRKDEPEP